MQPQDSTVEQVGTKQKKEKKGGNIRTLWRGNLNRGEEKNKIKRGRSNDFITGSFIKTATTHAVKITEFSSFITTRMHM